MFGRIPCFKVRIRARRHFLMSIIKEHQSHKRAFLDISQKIVSFFACCLRLEKRRLPTSWVSLFTLVYIEGVDGRTYIRTYGDVITQNFSNRWVTIFSYQWRSARAELRYKADQRLPVGDVHLRRFPISTTLFFLPGSIQKIFPMDNVKSWLWTQETQPNWIHHQMASQWTVIYPLLEIRIRVKHFPLPFILSWLE